MSGLISRRRWLAMRAFTLVELLVVIAIIAVLIAMLLPVLHRARDAAAAISCGSNMRNIGIAAQQYVNEYRVFPPAGYRLETSPGSNSWVDTTWDELLSAYMGRKFPHRIFICPGDKNDRYIQSGSVWNIQKPEMKRSYAAVRSVNLGSGANEFNPDGTQKYVVWSLADFGDNKGPHDNNQTYCRQKVRWMRHFKPSDLKIPASSALLYAESNQKRNIQGGITNGCWVKSTSEQSGQGEVDAPITHARGKKFNYAFADGHVELLRPAQTTNTGFTGLKYGYWRRSYN